MTHVSRAATVIVAVLIITGCGSQPSEPAAGAQAIHASGAASSQAQDVRKLRGSVGDVFANAPAPVEGEIRHAGVGADIIPLVGTITTKVGIEDAARNASTNPLVEGFTDRKPADTVILATYTNVFGETRPDGTMAPSVPAQTAWVFVWSGQAPGPASGPMSGGYRRPVPTDVTCDFYLVLSATTGSQLDAFRDCHQPAGAVVQ